MYMNDAGKKFAVFDIDGTVIRWQLYHAIVAQLAKDGRLSDEVAINIDQARAAWQQRRSLDSFPEYERVLVSEYHQALRNLSVEEFLAAADIVFEKYKDQTYTYTRDLISQLKQEGYLLFAISGSQQQIITKLGDYYGFDAVVGSDYEVKDGVFTGLYKIPGLERTKGSILEELVEAHAAIWEGSVGVGDTRGDVSMLELVEQPIAFNPSQELFDKAAHEGWNIVVERKNVVYELTRKSDRQYSLNST